MIDPRVAVAATDLDLVLVKETAPGQDGAERVEVSELEGEHRQRQAVRADRHVARLEGLDRVEEEPLPEGRRARLGPLRDLEKDDAPARQLQGPRQILHARVSCFSGSILSTRTIAPCSA